MLANVLANCYLNELLANSYSEVLSIREIIRVSILTEGGRRRGSAAVGGGNEEEDDQVT